MSMRAKYRPTSEASAKAKTLSAQELWWLSEQESFGIHDAVGEQMACWQKKQDTLQTAVHAHVAVTTANQMAASAFPTLATPSIAIPSTQQVKQQPNNAGTDSNAPTARAAVRAPIHPPTLALSLSQQRAQALAAQAENLTQLRQYIEDYDGCSLKATASQVVFGTGVENPLVMIIGEGPGSEEDRIGVPFVGPSGRLIQRCLGMIGVDCATNLYITNSVYWRPPANRTPTDAEVAACMPFVARQIALLQPKILLLVGARAAQSFLGLSSGITRLRGGWYSLAEGLAVQDIPTLAMFHPAYLFRNHAQKRLFWQDILALREKIDAMSLPVPWPEQPLSRFREDWHPKH